MRFLTFVKELASKNSEDNDFLAFCNWITETGYAKKNPHANTAQILLLLDAKRPDIAVWKGFDKAEKLFKELS